MIEYSMISSFFEKYIKFDLLEESEKFYIDFHMHTINSDGLITVEDIYEFTKDKKHLISVTDHNSIAGCIQAIEKGNINIIPGIEIGCEDGFEILAYFEKPSDLEEFYKNKLEPFRNRFRMAKSYKDYRYYLEELKAYNVFTSLPHINGLAQKNYLSNKEYINEVIKEVDAIESYNHTLPKKNNRIALNLRKTNNKFATFGSDAHVKNELNSFFNYQNEQYTRFSHLLKLLYNSYSLLGLFGKHAKYFVSGK